MVKKYKKWSLGTAGLSLALGSVLFLSSCGAGVSSAIIDQQVSTGTGESFYTNGGDFNTIAKKSLSTVTGMNSWIDSLGNEFIYSWFKNIQNLENIKEKWDEWIKSTDELWDTTLADFNTRHGSDAPYYIQNELLSPAGGTIEDWKKSKIIALANTEFTTLIEKDYIYLSNANNKSNPTELEINNIANINGITSGTSNNFIFGAEAVFPEGPGPLERGIADFKEFIFDEYVRNEMPYLTAMSLYKHQAPLNSSSKSKWFDVSKIQNFNKNQVNPIPVEANYAWQVYENPSISTVEGVNASQKYQNLVPELVDGKFLNNSAGGSINIPYNNGEYTDDSATSFLVTKKTSFDSLFLPFAASANYKLNTILYNTTDANVTIAPAIDPISIMGNFMTKTARPGAFSLPTEISGSLIGDYEGMTHISDTVDLGKKSPFILSRNEAGVHIIGIDRYLAMSQANDALGFNGVIEEMKNTLKWRHVQTREGFNKGGLTTESFNLNTLINTYFSSNKNDLLVKYIIEKGIDLPTEPPLTGNIFLFSKEISKIDRTPASGNFKNQLLLLPNESNLAIAIFAVKEEDSWKDVNNAIKTKFYSTQDPYVNKYSLDNFFNENESTVSNGIAGILPYTRNKTNGNYDSVGYFNTKTPEGVWSFDENKYKTLVTSVAPWANKYVDDLKLKKKTLDSFYQSFNQNILTDNHLINQTISSTISSDISNDIIISKIETQIAPIYNSTTNTFVTDNVDGGTIARPTTTTTPAEATNYINSQIANIFEKQYILRNYIKTNNHLYADGNWSTYDQLLAKSVDSHNSNIAKNEAGEVIINLFERKTLYQFILTIQYALGWDSKTKTYTFDSYKDYLSNNTLNNAKASYVWLDSDYADIVTGYGTNLDVDFTFVENPIALTKYSNTYGYQGQTPPTITDNKFDVGNTTLTNDTNYFNSVKPTNAPTSKGFTGFYGLQFENNNDLPQYVSSAIFNDSLTTNNGTVDVKNSGTLYNYGSRTNIVSTINSINNFSSLEVFTNQLVVNFNIDTKPIFDAITLKEQKVALIIQVENVAIIPKVAFEGVFNKQILNSEATSTSSKFFGTPTDQNTQVLLTQFNNDDVNKTFLEAGGLNWTSPNILNSSDEAFFWGLVDFATDNTSLQGEAFNNMVKLQGKITVFDVRLNNTLGSGLVNDFKRPK